MIAKIFRRTSFFNFLTTRLSKLDKHTIEVLKKSGSSVVVKLIGVLCGLLLSILLGKLVGADGVGIINLSTQIVTIFISIGMFGMPSVIVKEISIALSKGDEGKVKDVMYSSYLFCGGLTFVLAFILIGLTPIISTKFFNEPRLQIPLLLSLLAMTPQVFSRIFSASLIGYKRIWQSNLVDQTLSTVICLAIITSMYLLKIEVTIISVAVVYTISRCIVTLTMIVYWNRIHKIFKRRNYIGKQMRVVSYPLFVAILSGMIITKSDFIILGWLGSSKDVGLLTVTSRIALMTSFFLQITNSAVSPKIATLYAANKKEELEFMLQKVTKGLTFIGLFCLIVFIIFGSKILSIWGEEFSQAYWVLVILGVGELFNTSTGAVGLVLNLCGFEKKQRKISLIAVGINLVLSIILTKYYGLIGIALVSSFTVIALNLTKMILVRKMTGIKVSPFF